MEDEEAELFFHWVQSGKGATDTTVKRAKLERVVHKKYGEGIVLARIDDKVEVRFASGIKTLLARFLEQDQDGGQDE